MLFADLSHVISYTLPMGFNICFVHILLKLLTFEVGSFLIFFINPNPNPLLKIIVQRLCMFFNFWIIFSQHKLVHTFYNSKLLSSVLVPDIATVLADKRF